MRPARGIVPAAAVGALASSCGVALTATSGWLIVAANARPVILTLMVAIVGVRTFGIGRPALRYAERILTHRAALDTLTRERARVYRTLIPLAPARLGKRGRGRLLSGVVHDLDDVVFAQVRFVVPMLGALVSGLLAVALAALAGGRFAAVVAALIAGWAGVAWLVWWTERRAVDQLLAARARVDAVAELLASRLIELRAIGAGPTMQARLSAAQDDLAVAVRRSVTGRAVGTGLTVALSGIATAVMGWLAASAAQAGTIGAPVAAKLTLLPVAIAEVAAGIPDAVRALAGAQEAEHRLTRLLRTEPAVADTFGPTPQADELVLDGVTASWDGHVPALSPVSLQASRGERIAVVGPNGSGKSTLLAVLTRALDPAGGSYAIDGAPAPAFGLDGSRGRFAVVDDEPHVFAGSVRANLVLARPDANDDQLRAALAAAGLGGWLRELPDGLDTLVGDGGRGLSGGQRTRLSIARAVLCERPVVVLDEPVAHLDGATANDVLQRLDLALRGRTVFVTSHQQRGVDWCDRTIATVC